MGRNRLCDSCQAVVVRECEGLTTEHCSLIPPPPPPDTFWSRAQQSFCKVQVHGPSAERSSQLEGGDMQYGVRIAQLPTSWHAHTLYQSMSLETVVSATVVSAFASICLNLPHPTSRYHAPRSICS